MGEQAGITLDRCRILPLPVRGDQRGSLVAIERATGLPFEVARVYYIFGTKPGVTRGRHAHFDLIQWAICVNGSCTLVLDDGLRREQVRLDTPDVAVEIGPMVWREMCDFSADAVFLVIASKPYDEGDYIRDYNEFLHLARRG